ncbi:hypothetical protein AB0D08_28230 [Kitasatospora sp. NPDC048540]|uniref:hypothetical protein n=1 Tax=Kitasatospora sp. NPDC048540 TaxID=3155634 RepID=UPI0033F195A6
MHHRPEDPRTTAERAFRQTAALLTAVLLLALLAQLPPGSGGAAPGSRPHDAAWLLWPQGWNLFDNGQYAPELAAYRAGPAGWTAALTTPQAPLTTRWGPDRSPRTQAREIEALADLLPATAWQPCHAATLADCTPPPATATPPTAPAVRNPAAHPTLCGPIALTRETLARWGTPDAGHWRIDDAAILRVECP